MNKVKVLLAIPRKKDNIEVATEKMQHRKVFKRVWSEPEEREKRLLELKAIASVYPEYKWRIYETVNWRDLRKTYFEFQKKMLDWQRSDPTGKMDWLDKVHSEWVSTMMRPENCVKEDKLFLIDKDDKISVSVFELFLRESGIIIVEKYETPGGFHFITKPFDTRLAQDFKKFWNAEVKTDALRLVMVI